MKLNRTGSIWNRNERININDNWDKLEDLILTKGASFFETESFEKWLDKNNYIPKESVETIGDLPVDAENNEVRGVVAENALYLYRGNKWIKLLSIPLDMIDKKVDSKRIKSENAVYQHKFAELEFEDSRENVPQGLAYVKHQGIEKLFVLSNDTRLDVWDQNERQIISEYHFNELGELLPVIATSQILKLTHQSLSARVEDGQIYLYAGMNTGHKDENAKGFTRIMWKGSNTSQSDVTEYRMFGSTNSGHRFANHKHAAVSVSDDGRFLIMCSGGFEVAVNRTVFVYDLEEILQSNDSLSVMPLNIFNVKLAKNKDSHAVQDITCDGNYIYIYRGGIKTMGIYVTIYNLSGIYIGEYKVEGVLSEYNSLELSNETNLGTYHALEAEGIAIRNNNILLLTFSAWVNSETGVITRKRVVYELSNEKTEHSKPINRGIIPMDPPSSLHLYGNTVDVTYPYNDTVVIAGFDEVTRKVSTVLDIYKNKVLRFYDGDNNSADNNLYSSIYTTHTPTSGVLAFRAGSTVSNGAGIDLHTLDSKNGQNAGAVRLHATAPSGGGIEINFRGDATFGPNSDNVVDLGRSSGRWKNIYASSGVIQTSDRNEKEEIESIDEKLLKAWSEVDFKVFKFKDAIKEKGDEARKHIGLIAQDVVSAFDKYGLDAFEYGLITKENDRLGIRADECLFLEAALVRYELEKRG